MPKVLPPLKMTAVQRTALRKLALSRRTPRQVVLRCRILLKAAEGYSNILIAKELKTRKHTVALWRRRFHQGGVDAVWGFRTGRKRMPAEVEERVVHTTLFEKRTIEWSSHALAKHLGMSQMTILRIWRDHDLLPPWVTDLFLVRNPFIKKLRNIVGLYLRPPEHALALAVDEESQIPRTSSDWRPPWKKGVTEREATTSLVSFLNALDRRIVAMDASSNGLGYFLSFLRKIDRETPPHVALYLIADNYATCKHNTMQNWLAKHPRFHFRFTPSRHSWIGLVDYWLRKIKDKQICPQVLLRIAELEKFIIRYLNLPGVVRKPFVWTASPDSREPSCSQTQQESPGLG